MELSTVLLIVFTVMVAGQSIDNPIFPLEHCGNRTACFNITYMEKPDEYCKEFAGKVAVPSKLCVNGMILCDGHKYSAGCLYSVNKLRNNCDYAKENCYADLKEGATDPAPENPIFPVAACGNRTACSHIKHVERTDDFCKDYAGSVAVPSKLCLNAMIWCENRILRGSCLKSSVRLSTNCNYARDNCYKDLAQSETTTAGYTGGSTESSTSDATTVEYNTATATSTSYDTTTAGWYTTTSKSGATETTTAGYTGSSTDFSTSDGTTVTYDRTTSTKSTSSDGTTLGYTMGSSTEFSTSTTTDGEYTTPATTDTKVDTTLTESTTTQQTTSAGPRAGDPCTSAGKRAGNADNCLTFLECSGEVYEENACPEGYIYYERFSICVPGNGVKCQLYGQLRKRAIRVTPFAG